MKKILKWIVTSNRNKGFSQTGLKILFCYQSIAIIIRLCIHRDIKVLMKFFPAAAKSDLIIAMIYFSDQSILSCKTTYNTFLHVFLNLRVFFLDISIL